MTDQKKRMDYDSALEIAKRVKGELEPHCERIEIAGSIRRKKDTVGDIEIVCIPKPYDVGLFQSGIATAVNRWVLRKGKLPGKYTQWRLPDGINLDLFFANKENWGLIFAIRTGSAEFSHKALAAGWVRKGYNSSGGHLYKQKEKILVPEEKDLFDIIGIPWIKPEERNVK